MSGQNKPDPMSKKTQRYRIIIAILASLGLGGLALLIRHLIHKWRVQRTPPFVDKLDFKLTHQGLQSSEVEARRSDEIHQARLLAEKISKKERWQRNALTVFNLTVLVLAISQILLQDPLGALATFGAMVLSILMNIFQETRAAKQVETLAFQARPMASVIRDGRLQGIDQDELVVGDVLVAGKGDEILAEGVVLESKNLRIADPKLPLEGYSVIKTQDDNLVPGTYCESGWVIYQVSQLNIQIPGGGEPTELLGKIRNKTPLQIIIERVLYVLLVIVGIFYISFFLEVTSIRLLPPALMATYRQVISIIFSILPSGLLLMIVINYAVGSAKIAQADVLVHNSQTIESLAQVSTVGFIRHSGTMGLDIDLEIPSIPEDTLKISEQLVRQALGNYVHSIEGEKFPLSIIKENLEGDPRLVHQQARHLSLFGWEAMTFSSADMPGSFVIGYPDVLEPYLKPPDLPEEKIDPKGNSEIQSDGHVSQLRKFFGRDKLEKEQTEKKESERYANLAVERNLIKVQNDQQDQIEESGFFKKVRQRLQSAFSKKEIETKSDKGDVSEKVRPLIFAYSPTKQSVYDDDYHPQCPRDLITLCHIKFIEEVRPEVKQAVKIFQEENISIKILTDQEPNSPVALVKQLGIVDTENEDSFVTIGKEISQFSPEELQAAVINTTVFALTDSDQMVQIIHALQAQGEHVAVFGTSINDLSIMKSADLSITIKGSSPTVMDQADMIVLENSLHSLTDALQKGQRIVNGVLDVLKLNLTRICYILILLVVMYLAGDRTFFYHPIQGGLVNFFTVILPSIALSFWGSAKTVDGKNISRLLFHFFTPAAVVTSLAVLMIYFLFRQFGADVDTIQVAITHVLVLIGLLLVVFAQPPVRFLVAGGDYSGRWQPTLAAISIYILFQLFTFIPLAQSWLKLTPLASLKEYLFIFAIAGIWSVLVIAIWRFLWPERFKPSSPKSDEAFGRETRKPESNQ